MLTVTAPDSRSVDVLDETHTRYRVHFGVIGFVVLPRYSVGDVCRIIRLKDDKVRTLIRSERYGPYFDDYEEKPGVRGWHSLYWPYPTLVEYLRRTLQVPVGYRGSRDVRERRLALTETIVQTRDNELSINE